MGHSAQSYDAGQTNRSSSSFGVRGARQKRHPWRIGGSAHPLAKDGRVSLKPRMARRDLVRCPVSGGGRFNGSLLVCLRKDVALVSHCVLGLGRRTDGLGDGTFHVRRLGSLVRWRRDASRDGSFLRIMQVKNHPYSLPVRLPSSVLLQLHARNEYVYTLLLFPS